MLAWLLLIFVAAVMARWVASAWGGGGNPELTAAHTAEIARLREEVDTLGAQVLRLQEEQSFLTRLLADPSRAGEGAPAAPPAAPDPTSPENT